MILQNIMKLERVKSKARLMYFILFSFYALSLQAQPTIEIRLNLRGYPTKMPKKALILSNTALDNPVMLLKNTSGKILMEYKGTPTNEAWFPFSNYYSINFSHFQEKLCLKDNLKEPIQEYFFLSA